MHNHAQLDERGRWDGLDGKISALSWRQAVHDGKTNLDEPFTEALKDWRAEVGKVLRNEVCV